MPRIPVPEIPAAPPSAGGRLPNLLRALAASPAALDGVLALERALARGTLDAAMRARIALAVAEAKGCDYCLSQHVATARGPVGLDDAEITANRAGASNDPRAGAAVRFAAALVRGGICEADLSRVRAAGYGEAALLEIVALAALGTLTAWASRVSRPAIDFPLVPTRNPDPKGSLT